MKLRLEELTLLSGERVVVVAHSMGGFAWHFFQAWVPRQDAPDS